ncbi:hypothetical protein ACP4OV_028723 [Aristida adscensionis]
MTLQMEPPVPPPRRSVSTTCDLHPGEPFTGFCAACLRERLQGLEASSAAAAAAPGRRSTSAIRSLFSRPPFAAPPGPAAAAALPDLRRCKSFSCGRGGAADALAAAAAAGGCDEPQRRSCDVRGRSTLWALFHLDDRERVRDGTAFGAFPASSSAAAAALAAEVQPPPPPPPPMCLPEVFLEEIAAAEDSDEIIPVVEPVLVVDTSGEMETEAIAAREVRAMKDHIDLESSQPPPKKPPPKDLKEIAGSFWLAASVFSKKWQKWRRKQKLKKQEAAGSKAAAAAMPPPEKPSKPSFLRRRRLRGETGSEFAGGRRSCDTDPRFSLDAGRMSVDDAGFSWDGPRASWDGYLFGPGTAIGGLGRAPPPLSRLPPILSALEDSPAGVVERSDGQIPVEDDSQPEPDPGADVPGGTAQTRDYYMDSSSRRRRSLDRSSSVRRPSFEVPADPKPVAAPAAIGNGKESPLVGSSEFYHYQHAEDLFDHRFSTSSLVEDFSASLDAAFHGPAKKPRRWRKPWSLWGLINRRAAGRRGDASDVADRAFSEPWPELRARGFNGRMMMQRCNSNASARSSFSSNSGGGGGLGSSRRSWVDAYGHVKRRRGEECALERNRSARYSPGHAGADNGMLRFYLTPLRSASGRRVPAAGGRQQLRSQSFARTMLGLY